jgi:hypothetical protein
MKKQSLIILKRSAFLSMLLAVYVLTACSPVVTATSIATTSTPTVQPVDTSTPTVEHTPTPTAEVYSDNLTRECASTVAQPLSNASVIGSLLINPVELDAPAYLLDFVTGNKILLGIIASNESAVSKDGSLVAYWDLDAHSVVIATNSGEKIRTLPDPDERLTPAYWLDNHQLMLNHRNGERDGPYVVSSQILLDISTGKMQEWLPDYPNLDKEFSSVSWSIYGRFLVNPQIAFLVYQGTPGGLIMWDINAKKAVAEISGFHGNDTPWWSPDGTQIVTWGVPKLYDTLPYVYGGDLYTIDTSGNKKRLTYFTTTQYASESSFTWSPDGKNIAFLLQTAPDNKSALSVPELSILDVETGHVTNLCIQTDGFTWSPDGKYILINQGLNENRPQDEAYIVDLKNKLIWKVVENAFAEGWMTSSQVEGK